MTDNLPIASDRLILRRLRPADLQAFQAYRSDPLVAEYQGWEPMSEDESLAFLNQKSQGPFFESNEWFQLGIALHDSDRLIGDIGVCMYESGRVAEIGYSINRIYQGKGFGSEAVRLVAAYLFACTDADEIIATTDGRNLPSLRLLENIGMSLRETQRAEFKGEMCDEHVYVLRRRTDATPGQNNDRA